MLAGCRYGLITTRYLLTKNYPIVYNSNIRIYGCKHNAKLNTIFPNTTSLLFDYCDDYFILKYLKVENFPKLKKIYVSQCNEFDFSFINYPFNDQTIFTDTEYTDRYNEMLKLYIKFKFTHDILSIWNDDGMEPLKY